MPDNHSRYGMELFLSHGYRPRQLIPDTEQVQPHRDVDRERQVRCHERDSRSGEIDHKGDSKAPADAVHGVSIDVGTTQMTARDCRDQQVERTTAKDEGAAIEGNRRTCVRTSEIRSRAPRWEMG